VLSIKLSCDYKMWRVWTSATCYTNIYDVATNWYHQWWRNCSVLLQSEHLSSYNTSNEVHELKLTHTGRQCFY